MFKSIQKPFRTIRKELGLKPVQDYLSEMEGDYNLLCDSEFIFPVKRLPGNYKVIGPLYFKNDYEETEINGWLKEKGRKNILINMGSTGDCSILDVLKSELFNEYSFVVTGRNIPGLSSDNFFCKTFINNISILKNIDLLICHGGNGTLYQALAYGVPVLCIPSLFEQEYNIDRIKALGLGDEIISGTTNDNLLEIIRLWLSKKQNDKLVTDKIEMKESLIRESFLEAIEYFGRRKLNNRSC